MLLRARMVVPVTAPPIENGAVRVEGNRIAAVGPWPQFDREAGAEERIDLGEAALLPGLIDAHCHLDYTGMAGLLSPPKYFSDWIKGILALKAHWSYTEFAESWVSGTRMLEESGTTTVVDMEAVPELLPEVWDATALRVISLLEMTGVRSGRPPEFILAEATDRMDALAGWRNPTGLAPHALYSAAPALVRRAALEARKRQCLLCVHVAESAEEFDMVARAEGRLHEWLKKQRDMSDCGRETPVQRCRALGALGPNFLAVHANYLGSGDAALLAETGSSVVHCPRSHEYFQHRPFPLAELAQAGVNVCLGTDSLASTRKERGQRPRLDMFAEMRALAGAHPDLPPEFLLRMATVNAARAIGQSGQVGEIRAGALADLIALPFEGPSRDLFETVALEPCEVRTAMIDGRWVKAPTSSS